MHSYNILYTIKNDIYLLIREFSENPKQLSEWDQISNLCLIPGRKFQRDNYCDERNYSRAIPAGGYD